MLPICFTLDGSSASLCFTLPICGYLWQQSLLQAVQCTEVQSGGIHFKVEDRSASCTKSAKITRQAAAVTQSVSFAV